MEIISCTGNSNTELVGWRSEGRGEWRIPLLVDKCKQLGVEILCMSEGWPPFCTQRKSWELGKSGKEIVQLEGLPRL